MDSGVLAGSASQICHTRCATWARLHLVICAAVLPIPPAPGFACEQETAVSWCVRPAPGKRVIMTLLPGVLSLPLPLRSFGDRDHELGLELWKGIKGGGGGRGMCILERSSWQIPPCGPCEI